MVDLAQVEWHQFIKEYLEFAAAAKDFYQYLKMPESIRYPLTNAYNTARYRSDIPDFAKPPTV